MLGQAVTVLALLVLSRIYSPADFGLLTVVLSFSAMLAPAAALRFESALMLPTEIAGARALVRLALTATILVSIIGTGSAWFMKESLTEGGSRIAFSLYVGATILTTAMFVVASQVSLRENQYKEVAARSLYQALATTIYQTMAGFLRYGHGLVHGHLVGRLVGISFLVKRNLRYYKKASRGDLVSALRTYWRFPAIFTPSVVLNSVGLQAPLLVSAAIYSLSDTGQLGMAERIAGVPLLLIGAAIAQFLEAELAEITRRKAPGAVSQYLAMTKRLLIPAAMLSITFWVAGGWLVEKALGSEWVLCGHLIKAMSIAAGCRLVASPLSRVLIVLQRPWHNFALDLGRIALLAVAVALAVGRDANILEFAWFAYSALCVIYIVTWIVGLLACVRYDASCITTLDGERSDTDQ